MEGLARAIEIANGLANNKPPVMPHPDRYVWSSMRHRMNEVAAGKVGSKPSRTLKREPKIENVEVCDAAFDQMSYELYEVLDTCCNDSWERDLIRHLPKLGVSGTATLLGCHVDLVSAARAAIFNRVKDVFVANGDGWMLGRPKQGRRASKPNQWKPVSPMKNGKRFKVSPLSTRSR